MFFWKLFSKIYMQIFIYLFIFFSKKPKREKSCTTFMLFFFRLHPSEANLQVSFHSPPLSLQASEKQSESGSASVRLSLCRHPATQHPPHPPHPYPHPPPVHHAVSLFDGRNESSATPRSECEGASLCVRVRARPSSPLTHIPPGWKRFR